MLKCEFENGNKASLRHVVASAIILKGDPSRSPRFGEAGPSEAEAEEILLGKRAVSLVEGGKWALPGGFMDREETLVECIRREVLEETGYEISDPVLMQIMDSPRRPNDWERENVAFIYFCNAGERVGEGDDESSELKWFQLSQLPPREEIAFDHYDNIEVYLRYKKENFSLPYQP